MHGLLSSKLNWQVIQETETFAILRHSASQNSTRALVIAHGAFDPNANGDVYLCDGSPSVAFFAPEGHVLKSTISHSLLHEGEFLRFDKSGPGDCLSNYCLEGLDDTDVLQGIAASIRSGRFTWDFDLIVLKSGQSLLLDALLGELHHYTHVDFHICRHDNSSPIPLCYIPGRSALASEIGQRLISFGVDQNGQLVGHDTFEVFPGTEEFVAYASQYLSDLIDAVSVYRDTRLQEVNVDWLTNVSELQTAFDGAALRMGIQLSVGRQIGYFDDSVLTQLTALRTSVEDIVGHPLNLSVDNKATPSVIPGHDRAENITSLTQAVSEALNYYDGLSAENKALAATKFGLGDADLTELRDLSATLQGPSADNDAAVSSVFSQLIKFDHLFGELSQNVTDGTQLHLPWVDALSQGMQLRRLADPSFQPVVIGDVVDRLPGFEDSASKTFEHVASTNIPGLLMGYNGAVDPQTDGRHPDLTTALNTLTAAIGDPNSPDRAVFAKHLFAAEALGQANSDMASRLYGDGRVGGFVFGVNDSLPAGTGAHVTTYFVPTGSDGNHFALPNLHLGQKSNKSVNEGLQTLYHELGHAIDIWFSSDKNFHRDAAATSNSLNPLFRVRLTADKDLVWNVGVEERLATGTRFLGDIPGISDLHNTPIGWINENTFAAIRGLPIQTRYNFIDSDVKDISSRAFRIPESYVTDAYRDIELSETSRFFGNLYEVYQYLNQTQETLQKLRLFDEALSNPDILNAMTESQRDAIRAELRLGTDTISSELPKLASATALISYDRILRLSDPGQRKITVYPTKILNDAVAVAGQFLDASQFDLFAAQVALEAALYYKDIIAERHNTTPEAVAQAFMTISAGGAIDDPDGSIGGGYITLFQPNDYSDLSTLTRPQGLALQGASRAEVLAYRAFATDLGLVPLDTDIGDSAGFARAYSQAFAEGRNTGLTEAEFARNLVAATKNAFDQLVLLGGGDATALVEPLLTFLGDSTSDAAKQIVTAEADVIGFLGQIEKIGPNKVLIKIDPGNREALSGAFPAQNVLILSDVSNAADGTARFTTTGTDTSIEIVNPFEAIGGYQRYELVDGGVLYTPLASGEASLKFESDLVTKLRWLESGPLNEANPENVIASVDFFRALAAQSTSDQAAFHEAIGRKFDAYVQAMIYEGQVNPEWHATLKTFLNQLADYAISARTSDAGAFSDFFSTLTANGPDVATELITNARSLFPDIEGRLTQALPELVIGIELVKHFEIDGKIETLTKTVLGTLEQTSGLDTLAGLSLTEALQALNGFDTQALTTYQKYNFDRSKALLQTLADYNAGRRSSLDALATGLGRSVPPKWTPTELVSLHGINPQEFLNLPPAMLSGTVQALLDTRVAVREGLQSTISADVLTDLGYLSASSLFIKFQLDHTTLFPEALIDGYLKSVGGHAAAATSMEDYAHLYRAGTAALAADIISKKTSVQDGNALIASTLNASISVLEAARGQFADPSDFNTFAAKWTAIVLTEKLGPGSFQGVFSKDTIDQIRSYLDLGMGVFDQPLAAELEHIFSSELSGFESDGSTVDPLEISTTLSENGSEPIGAAQRFVEEGEDFSRFNDAAENSASYTQARLTLEAQALGGRIDREVNRLRSSNDLSSNWAPVLSTIEEVGSGLYAVDFVNASDPSAPPRRLYTADETLVVARNFLDTHVSSALKSFRPDANGRLIPINGIGDVNAVHSLNSAFAVQALIGFFERERLAGETESDTLSTVLRAHEYLGLAQIGYGQVLDGLELIHLIQSARPAYASGKSTFGTLKSAGSSLSTGISLALGGVDVVLSLASAGLDIYELTQAETDSERAIIGTQLALDAGGVILGSTSLGLGITSTVASSAGAATVATAAATAGAIVGGVGVIFAGLGVGIAGLVQTFTRIADGASGVGQLFYEIDKTYRTGGFTYDSARGVLVPEGRGIIERLDLKNGVVDFGSHHIYRTEHGATGSGRIDYFFWAGDFPDLVWDESQRLSIREGIGYTDRQVSLPTSERSAEVVVLPVAPRTTTFSYDWNILPGSTTRHDAGFDVIRRLESEEKFDYDFYIFPSEYIIDEVGFNYVNTSIRIDLDAQNRTLLVPDLPSEYYGKVYHNIHGDGGRYVLSLNDGARFSIHDQASSTWILETSNLASQHMHISGRVVHIGDSRIDFGPINPSSSQVLLRSIDGDSSVIDFSRGKAVLLFINGEALNDDGTSNGQGRHDLLAHIQGLEAAGRLGPVTQISNYHDGGSVYGVAFYDSIKDLIVYSRDGNATSILIGRVEGSAPATLFYDTQNRMIYRVDNNTHSTTDRFDLSALGANAQLSGAAIQDELLYGSFRGQTASGIGVDYIFHLTQDGTFIVDSLRSEGLFDTLQGQEGFELSRLAWGFSRPVQFASYVSVTTGDANDGVVYLRGSDGAVVQPGAAGQLSLANAGSSPTGPTVSSSQGFYLSGTVYSLPNVPASLDSFEQAIKGTPGIDYNIKRLDFADAESGSAQTLGAFFSGNATPEDPSAASRSFERFVHQIQGRIFLRAGAHSVTLNHDDGLRLRIGGKVVFAQNYWDGRTADRAVFTVPSDGYYELDALYFDIGGPGNLKVQIDDKILNENDFSVPAVSTSANVFLSGTVYDLPNVPASLESLEQAIKGTSGIDYDIERLDFADAAPGAAQTLGGFFGGNATPEDASAASRNFERFVHQIQGRIFLRAGSHTLTLNHDDGLRLRIGGKVVFAQNYWDGRTADTAVFEVPSDGYYELDALYFDIGGPGNLNVQIDDKVLNKEDFAGPGPVPLGDLLFYDAADGELFIQSTAQGPAQRLVFGAGSYLSAEAYILATRPTTLEGAENAIKGLEGVNYDIQRLDFAGAGTGNNQSLGAFFCGNATLEDPSAASHSYHNVVHEIQGRVYLDAGEHTVSINHDDGLRLRLGGEVIFSDNGWTQGGPDEVRFTAPTDGYYELSGLYYEGGGPGSLEVTIDGEVVGSNTIVSQEIVSIVPTSNGVIAHNADGLSWRVSTTGEVTLASVSADWLKSHQADLATSLAAVSGSSNEDPTRDAGDNILARLTGSNTPSTPISLSGLRVRRSSGELVATTAWYLPDSQKFVFSAAPETGSLIPIGLSGDNEMAWVYDNSRQQLFGQHAFVADEFVGELDGDLVLGGAAAERALIAPNRLLADETIDSVAGLGSGLQVSTAAGVLYFVTGEETRVIGVKERWLEGQDGHLSAEATVSSAIPVYDETWSAENVHGWYLSSEDRVIRLPEGIGVDGGATVQSSTYLGYEAQGKIAYLSVSVAGDSAETVIAVNDQNAVEVIGRYSLAEVFGSAGDRTFALVGLEGSGTHDIPVLDGVERLLISGSLNSKTYRISDAAHSHYDQIIIDTRGSLDGDPGRLEFGANWTAETSAVSRVDNDLVLVDLQNHHNVIFKGAASDPETQGFQFQTGKGYVVSLGEIAEALETEYAGAADGTVQLRLDHLKILAATELESSAADEAVIVENSDTNATAASLTIRPQTENTVQVVGTLEQDSIRDSEVSTSTAASLEQMIQAMASFGADTYGYSPTLLKKEYFEDKDRQLLTGDSQMPT